MLSPIQKTGMTTLKTRIPSLANFSLGCNTNRPLPDISEPENWDDDLHANKFVFPQKDHAWDSSDDNNGINEEDKAVTAHHHKGPPGERSPLPPMPSLPPPLEPVGETFPGSPTLSVFSIPTFGLCAAGTHLLWKGYQGR